MNKKILYISIATVVVALIAFKLIANKQTLDEKKKVTNTSLIEIPVETANAEFKNFSYQLKKTGTIIPFQEVDVTAVSSGRVVELRFDLGSKVVKGQKLAALDSRMNQLALESSELSERKLKADYEKYQSLLAGNAATETQVNDIKFNYETAANKSEQIRKQLKDATIVAPISGEITKKNIEIGEYVNPGNPLGTIVNVHKLKVKVMVNESEAYNIKEGQSVKVSSEIYPDVVYSGKVTFVSPTGDESHNYPVELVMDNKPGKNLKAGTVVTVDFSSKTSSHNVLVIPRNALVESIKNPYVYVAEGTIAKERKIQVGREFSGYIEVLDGLKEGEAVVTTGQINLSEGSKLQIVK